MPAVAVHMVERFKVPTVENEVRRHVNEEPQAVVDVPEALRFLVGDSLDVAGRNRVCKYVRGAAVLFQRRAGS
jgi:phosphatidylinositol 4-kinase A